MAHEHGVDLVLVDEGIHLRPHVQRHNVVGLLLELGRVLRASAMGSAATSPTDHHAVSRQNHPRRGGAIDVLQIILNPAE